MSCGCKNKEYHPCQNGGECKCGGKCKQENYSNAVGSIDEFKEEDNSIGSAVLKLVGGISLAIVAIIIYSKLKK
jgi:hypothetical protein|tara:strand:- start:9175 stop:9396 length:222 start_codon:yes stop_codon:yes gene_type:complete